jgi:hypothetical protein
VKAARRERERERERERDTMPNSLPTFSKQNAISFAQGFESNYN